MQKKELALQVIERLKKEYPDTGCSLDYDDAWKLLVSVRLAAQCTERESMWSCRICTGNSPGCGCTCGCRCGGD